MTDRYPVFTKWMQSKGFVAEHKFASDRKWRMDYAHLGLLISIEVEGGIWTGGRHTRGSGFLKDMEKYSEAAILGWCVLRITPDMIKKGAAYQLVDRALTMRPYHAPCAVPKEIIHVQDAIHASPQKAVNITAKTKRKGLRITESGVQRIQKK